jgi:predicted small secreted protein
MKKKNYLILSLTLLLVLSSFVFFTGCNTTTLNGTYYRDVNDTRYYSFNEDGTCVLKDGEEEFNGTYTREGGKVTITFEDGGNPREGKISGKTLKIDENGYENKYVKK